MTSYLLAVACLITVWALGWAFGRTGVAAERCRTSVQRNRADRAERRLASRRTA